MSPLYITLVHDQGHCPAFPTDPDQPQPLILHITLMTWPLISDAMGATLSPLRLRESSESIKAEFSSEGAESKEVSESPLEEAEVSEQPLEGVLGKGLEWKEHVVVLGTAGRGLE